MSFELSLLILLSVLYLVLLFSVAWATERGLLPRSLVRHPAIYTLSIGVYASAWAFWHCRSGLSVRLRIPDVLPWRLRRLPAGAGAAQPDIAHHPHLPAVVPGRPVRLPFPQHLGRHPD